MATLELSDGQENISQVVPSTGQASLHRRRADFLPKAQLGMLLDEVVKDPCELKVILQLQPPSGMAESPSTQVSR